MGQAGRAPRRHPQPDRAHEALAVLDKGEAPPLEQRASRRVAAKAPSSRSKTSTSPQLFRFYQFDFASPLGPADGRYLVRRGEEDVDVVVFKMLDSPPRRRRRPKRISDAPQPQAVRTARVTVVAAEGFGDEAAAKHWLDRVRGDSDEREAEVDKALRTVNRAIHAQRVAAGDPYLSEVVSDRAVQVRLGYGRGEEVVEGHWSAACALPPPRRRGRRRQMLAPQQQLAGILSGRSRAYPSEDLALRARVDLEQGRSRQAALQLQVAVRALAAERSESDAHGGGQPVSLPLHRSAEADELAAAALEAELEETQVSLLDEILSELEKLLRQRRGRSL